MREFDQRIEAWKKQAMVEFEGDVDRVAELENHLRQMLEEVTPGLSPQSAWNLAMKRLGDLHELGREFTKIDRGRMDLAAIWGIIIVGVVVLSGLIFPIMALIRQKYADGLLQLHIVLLLAGYTASVIAGLLGGYYGLRIVFAKAGNHALRQSLPRIVLWLSAAAILLTSLGVGIGLITAANHTGRVWMWDGREIGALALILWHAGLLTFFKSRIITMRRLLAVNIVTAPLTIIVWFVLGLYIYSAHSTVGGVAVLAIWIAASLSLAAAVWHSNNPPYKESLHA